MLLDGVAQRAGSEVGVEASLDEKGEDFGGGGEVDSLFGEEGEFGGEHGLGDFELDVVGEAIEDELFGDTGEEFGTEGVRWLRTWRSIVANAACWSCITSAAPRLDVSTM